MIRTPPFPTSPSDLSADVLGEALGAAVQSFTASPVGADRGMLGDLVLVEPVYHGKPGPGQVVAKFAAPREACLASARRSGSHQRELRFYDELAPSTPVRVPYVYGSWYDPDSAEFLVVQEAIDNDPTVDQIRGITIHQAELVLREIARLHATWWDHPRLATVDWLPRLDGAARRHNLAEISTNGWEPLCALLGDSLTAHERSLGSQLAARLDDVLMRMGSLSPTLIHSDLRADNLLFSPDGSAVTLVDWQGAGIGPAGWDLAYFLSQSLDVDMRRRHESDLLDQYVCEAQRIRPELTAQQLLAGYGESMIFGLVVATSLPLVSDPGQPRVRSLAESMARRAIAALADHGQLWDAPASRQEST
jgi:Phosphotransferase enzyme family